MKTFSKTTLLLVLFAALLATVAVAQTDGESPTPTDPLEPSETFSIPETPEPTNPEPPETTAPPTLPTLPPRNTTTAGVVTATSPVRLPSLTTPAASPTVPPKNAAQKLTGAHMQGVAVALAAVALAMTFA